MPGRGMNIVTGHGNKADEVFDVLRLIANPAELEKAINRIQDEQIRLQEQIALAGKANEINAIHKRLDGDVERARKEVEDARAEAAQLIADAEEKITERLEESQAHIADSEKTAETKLNDAVRRQERAQKVLASNERMKVSLETQAEELKKREGELNREIEKVRQLKDQLLKEKSELAAARDTLKAAVG